VAVEFLVDTGADRTVLSADALQKLGLTSFESEEDISGLGGATTSVVVETKLHLVRETGTPVLFNSQLSAVTDPTALDACVLGRDIMDLFAVIIDRPQNVVCLVGQRHRYAIVQE
jgi:predicted aspartyl protease